MGLSVLSVAFPWMAPPAGLILAALLGAIVGSFLGVVLARWPLGRDFVGGRSACAACGKVLGPGELVPLVSWLVQRGRCRACGVPIGLDPLLAEIGGAAVGIGSVTMAREGQVLAAMALGWQLLLIALLDARHFWLPRALLLLLASTALVPAGTEALVLGGIGPLLRAFAGGATGLTLLGVVAWGYRAWRGRDGMGGGDPWLMGAIGMWLGIGGVVPCVLGGSVIGLAMALVRRASGKPVNAETMLPLGTCLALAAWPLYLAHGDLPLGPG